MDDPTDPLKTYRNLQCQLWDIRAKEASLDDPSFHGTRTTTARQADMELEDDILDQMDAAWDALTKDQRQILNSQGPQCWPDIPRPPEQ